MKSIVKYILIFFPFFLSAADQERKKQIYIVQDWTPTPNDSSFATSSPLKEIYETLKLKNTSLKVTNLAHERDSNELKYIVVFNKPSYFKPKILNRFPYKKAILFAWEPPTTQKNLYNPLFLSHFKRIYTWDDDLVDNHKFFKFYYPCLQSMHENLPSFQERKLLTQISSCKKSKHPKELYSARLSAIQFFQNYDANEFEFYGYGWEQKGYLHYKGVIANKLETLKNYRFSLCYENMSDIKGYITEKIFDCFAVGTIPIYWGASNVTDYIPKECFIDRRDFKNFEEVYHYIKSLDQKTYESYLQTIEIFLESDQAKLFSQGMFNVIFLEAIRFP